MSVRKKPLCPSCEGGTIGVDDICTDCIVKINRRNDLKQEITNYILLNNGGGSIVGTPAFSSLTQDAEVVAKNILGVLDQTKLSIEKIKNFKNLSLLGVGKKS